MKGSELARYLFAAGTIPLLLAAFGHAVGTVLDVRRPRMFTPVDDAVRHSMAATSLRLAPKWTNMWDTWLGFNISHGAGLAAFTLLLLLLAIFDFDVVSDLAFVAPMAAGIAALYFVLAIRFWFFAPAIAAATSTLLFAASSILLRT